MLLTNKEDKLHHICQFLCQFILVGFLFIVLNLSNLFFLSDLEFNIPSNDFELCFKKSYSKDGTSKNSENVNVFSQRFITSPSILYEPNNNVDTKKLQNPLTNYISSLGIIPSNLDYSFSNNQFYLANLYFLQASQKQQGWQVYSFINSYSFS